MNGDEKGDAGHQPVRHLLSFMHDVSHLSGLTSPPMRT